MAMKLNEIMVRELREEHRDREWVDKEGTHWMWCEDQWMVSRDTRYGWMTVAELRFTKPVPPERVARYGGKYNGSHYVEDDDNPMKNRGPFVEGLYYAATRGRR